MLYGTSLIVGALLTIPSAEERTSLSGSRKSEINPTSTPRKVALSDLQNLNVPIVPIFSRHYFVIISAHLLNPYILILTYFSFPTCYYNLIEYRLV